MVFASRKQQRRLLLGLKGKTNVYLRSVFIFACKSTKKISFCYFIHRKFDKNNKMNIVIIQNNIYLATYVCKIVTLGAIL